MKPIISVSAIRDFETSCISNGVSEQELMTRAGAVVALQAAQLSEGGKIVVFCGMGKNGGDGWVCADNLEKHGYDVTVVTAATPALIKNELSRKMANSVADRGIPILVSPSDKQLEKLLSASDVCIDAMFGTGFSGALKEPYAQWAEILNASFSGSVVSIDVPSGIDAQTGLAQGPYVHADVTVTMFAAKPGLISGEGRAASGKIVCVGLVDEQEGIGGLDDLADLYMLEDADYEGILAETNPLQDKYTHGRVLVVGGSAQYPGAAIMTAAAAARSGAGYVTLAVPYPVVACAQAHMLTIPVIGLPSDEDGTFDSSAASEMAALAEKADVVIVGPGMTTSFGACEVVRSLLDSDAALVLDADALNALVKICTGSAEEHPEPLRREKPLVLTPHTHELSRLVNKEVSEVAALSQAVEASQSLVWAVGSSNMTVLAKGPVSSVVGVEGSVIPEAGSPCLATAGSGDVLAGIVGAVLAQNMAACKDGEELDTSDMLMTVAFADRVHALCGELAIGRCGSRGVVATDLIEFAGLAIDELLTRADYAALEGMEDSPASLEANLVLSQEDSIVPPKEVQDLIRSDRMSQSAADDAAAFAEPSDDAMLELEEPLAFQEKKEPAKPEPADNSPYNVDVSSPFARLFMRREAALRNAKQEKQDVPEEQKAPVVPAQPEPEPEPEPEPVTTVKPFVPASPLKRAISASVLADPGVSVKQPPLGTAGETTQMPPLDLDELEFGVDPLSYVVELDELDEPYVELAEEPVQEPVPEEPAPEEPVSELIQIPAQEAAQEPVEEAVAEAVQEAAEELAQEAFEAAEEVQESLAEQVAEFAEEFVEQPVEEFIEEPFAAPTNILLSETAIPEIEEEIPVVPLSDDLVKPLTKEDVAQVLEDYHEQATIHIDDPKAKPIDERPRAKAVLAKKRRFRF
ncbi:MAG: NAD(P)H-hydrate dehydratase [Coriobacteriales bacterium]|nr:NAD(P)H-hydrate dehydratase [Coriobacteriales bacterium]